MKRQNHADKSVLQLQDFQRQDYDSSKSFWSDLCKSLEKIDFWQDVQYVIGSFNIWASRIVAEMFKGQSCILWAF